MFKRLLTLMMVLSIFATSASASTQDGLKAAFQDLHFSITVEWDQKDKAFYAEQMKKFTATLRDLQSKGLTTSQLVDFVKSEVKNEQVGKDLETAFNMVQINKMSVEDASKYMIETMKKSYSAGASYRGEALIYVAAALLVVGVAIAIATGSSVRGGNGGGGCYWVTECYDVYDYYGWYLYTECYDYCY